MKKTTIILLIIAVSIIAISGCTQKISEIKTQEYIGKSVSVTGTAQGTVKIGSISGFTLVDEAGDKIGVSSETLPKEGDTVTVKGILMKDSLLGYYIQANKIN